MMDYKDKIAKALANPLVIVFIIVQIFVVAFLVVSFIGQSSNRANEMTVGDDSVLEDERNDAPEFELPQLKDLDLPQNSVTNIQRALLSIMKKNNTSIKTSGLKTSIRAKKTKTFGTQRINYLTFIVDIDDYKQSYQITHEWSKDEDNKYLAPNDSVIVFCVYDENKIKYQDFQCDDGLSLEPKYSIIKHYVGFADFGDFSAIDAENGDTALSVDMTSTEKTEAQTVSEIEKWIQSMGFTPKGFTYNFYYGENWEEE